MTLGVWRSGFRVPFGVATPDEPELIPTGGRNIDLRSCTKWYSVYRTVQRDRLAPDWRPPGITNHLLFAMETKPPLPPFTLETAIQKARLAEDAWNSRDPERVALAYTVDSHWRNRAEFFNGRPAIIEFLKRKWAKELDYRLIKELWAFHQNRISVRFQYEWHDDSGNWFRAHGNEQWEFDDNGLMRRREASINDVPIQASDRKFFWPAGPRPADHPGLSELGL